MIASTIPEFSSWLQFLSREADVLLEVVDVGEVNLDEERIILEPSGSFNDLDDLRKTIIPVGDRGDVVYLDDITTIEKGYKTPSGNLVRVNGEKAIALSISLKDGANIIQLGKAVDEKVRHYNREFPLGVEIIRLSGSCWQATKGYYRLPCASDSAFWPWFLCRSSHP